MFWRKSRAPQIVLSFRADGPYWSDLIHLLAYPEGISYVWPFRYDARLIEPSLRDDFASASTAKLLRGTPILVGARFHSRHTDKFVPIRLANLIQVDSSSGIYSFYFRLGPAMDFVDATDLVSCAVNITQDVDHLAFRTNLTATKYKVASPTKLGPSWKEFASLIANEVVLPINEGAQRSLFFHIPPIRSATGDVKPERIFKSWSGEHVFGFKLKEGRRYELKFSHFVPSLETTNTTIREVLVEPKLPATNLEPNTTHVTMIGNYGVESLLLGAARPSQVWEQLELAPTEKIYTAQDGTTKINSHEIKIPLRVAWSLRRWIGRTFLPAIFLFIALAALGAANILDKMLEKLSEGTLTWNKILMQWPLSVRPGSS